MLGNLPELPNFTDVFTWPLPVVPSDLRFGEPYSIAASATEFVDMGNDLWQSARQCAEEGP